jgi:hypothetical protein
MDEEERHLAGHQFERDVVKPQGFLETVQRDNDRVVSVCRGHDLENRGEEELLMPGGKNRPSILGRADGLPMRHGAKPLGLVEAEWSRVR